MNQPQPVGQQSHSREAIGKSIEDLDTPALLLDLDASDHNLKQMADYFSQKGSKLRPHFKNHKCTTLARRQMDAGSALGLTCAKVGEAEVLVDHGFEDILIANQVVGVPKIQRLVELARRAHVSVAIDDLLQAEWISQAAAAAGVSIGLLVEVDIGMGRCGVKPGQAALELACAVQGLAGTRFLGIQAFEGHLIYMNDRDEREPLVVEAMQRAVDTRRIIEKDGIRVDLISGSATANYDVTAAMGIDEIQAGTYATMDWRYHEVRPEFKIAMSVLATVISKRRGEAVLDVGVKGAGGEFGLPKVAGAPEAEIPFFIAEEHCLVRNPPDWCIGDTVRFISSHACTTCNLYRQFFVHQGGEVVDIWPIEASGRMT